MNLLLLSAVLVLCTFVSCDRSPTESQRSLSEKLQSELDLALMSCRDRRGVSAAIAGPDENLWLGVSGMSDPEVSELITEDMLFNIGWSVPELYASALILLYEKEDLLSLDDPISRWLSDYEYLEEDSITVDHLLRHMKGQKRWCGS